MLILYSALVEEMDRSVQTTASGFHTYASDGTTLTLRWPNGSAQYLNLRVYRSVTIEPMEV